MKNLPLRVLFLLLAFAAAPLRAGEVSYEIESTASYVSRNRTSLGDGRSGDVSEQADLLRCVVSPQFHDALLLRLGAEAERYSFGLPSRATLPNTLQSVDLIVGFDTRIFDALLLRIEAHPGFYSDFNDITGHDFNVPVIVGASYLAGADLQWVLGAYIDANSRYPVLPGAGVRWKFARQWTLNAILPTPRLEYEFSKMLTLYGGADIKETSYRVDNEFGTSHGNPKLNGAALDYTEIRAGAGASWKISHAFTLELEGGYMPYREFDFHRAGLREKTRDGAPYGQIGLSAKF